MFPNVVRRFQTKLFYCKENFKLQTSKGHNNSNKLFLFLFSEDFQYLLFFLHKRYTTSSLLSPVIELSDETCVELIFEDIYFEFTGFTTSLPSNEDKEIRFKIHHTILYLVLPEGKQRFTMHFDFSGQHKLYGIQDVEFRHCSNVSTSKSQ